MQALEILGRPSTPSHQLPAIAPPSRSLPSTTPHRSVCFYFQVQDKSVSTPPRPHPMPSNHDSPRDLTKWNHRISAMLAVTSLATFWAIPFSAVLILITLRIVPKNRSWPSQITRWAAALCTLYTSAIAAWMLVMTASVLTANWRLAAP